MSLYEACLAHGRCPRSSSASSSPGSPCPARTVLLAYRPWTSWARGGQAKEKQETGLPEPIRLMVQAHGREADTDNRWEPWQRARDDRTRRLLPPSHNPVPFTLPGLAERPPPPGSSPRASRRTRPSPRISHGTLSAPVPQETGSLLFPTFLPRLVTAVTML